MKQKTTIGQGSQTTYAFGHFLDTFWLFFYSSQPLASILDKEGDQQSQIQTESIRRWT